MTETEPSVDDPPAEHPRPEPIAIEMPLALPVPAGSATRAPRSWAHLSVAAVLTAILPLAVLLLATARHPSAVSAIFPRSGPTTAVATATTPVPAASAAVAPAAGTRSAGIPGAAAGSASGTPTAAASSTTPGVPAPSGPVPAAGPLTATFAVDGHPGPDATGYHLTLTISDHGTDPVTGWRVVIDLPDGEKVTKAAGANYDAAGTQVTLTPVDPTRTVKPGQSVTVKLEVAGSTAPAVGCTIDGRPCG